MHRVLTAVSISLALVAAGCACDGSSDVAGATSTPSAESGVDVGSLVGFEAVLTNSGCTLEGPAQVGPGEHWLIFVNIAGFDDVELAVRQINDG